MHKLKNTHVDNKEFLYVALPMYNLIEYSDNYSNTPGCLYQLCMDEPKVSITDYELFTFKSRFLNNVNNAGIISAEIAVLSKYLSNFWITLEMSSINWQINLILTWSENCAISEGNRVTAFAIICTKLYVTDNIKPLQPLKLGFKRTIINLK